MGGEEELVCYQKKVKEVNRVPLPNSEVSVFNIG